MTAKPASRQPFAPISATVGARPRLDLRIFSRWLDVSGPVSRNELFVAVTAIGFMNGISERVASAVRDNGVVPAFLDTFNISIVVWIAWAIGTVFLLRESRQPIERRDWIVVAVACAAFLIPVVPLSWLALSGLAFHLLRTSQRSSFLNRGAWILLGTTVPMFWSRIVFEMLSGFILEGDAILVGWLVGTPRSGNAIQFADGSGYLWIAPNCSSLANVSLAILCWMTFIKVWERPATRWNIAWAALACMAVIAINVARISLMGLYPEYFDLIHGPIGATIASWIILGVMVGTSLIGVQYDHRKAFV